MNWARKGLDAVAFGRPYTACLIDSVLIRASCVVISFCQDRSSQRRCCSVFKTSTRCASTAGMCIATFVGVGGLALAHPHQPAVGSGSSRQGSCTGRANISYGTTYSARLPGYVVNRLPIHAGRRCAHFAYKLTLTDANGHRAVSTGRLDARGAAAAQIPDSRIGAATVTVSLVIAN